MQKKKGDGSIPMDLKSRELKVKDLIKQKNFEEAAAILELLLRAFPKSSKYLFNLALVNFKIGKLELAYEKIEQGLKISPLDQKAQELRESIKEQLDCEKKSIGFEKYPESYFEKIYETMTGNKSRLANGLRKKEFVDWAKYVEKILKIVNKNDRNNRTELYLKNIDNSLDIKKLREIKILIVASENWIKHFDGQCMVSMLANQYCRTFQYIDLSLPKTKLIAGTDFSVPVVDEFARETFTENIYYSMIAVDKEVICEYKDEKLQEKYNIVLIVGDGTKIKPNIRNIVDNSDLVFQIASHNWNAYIAKEDAKGNEYDPFASPTNDIINPLGAIMAATLAVNESIKYALSLYSGKSSFLKVNNAISFSTYTLTGYDSIIHLENGVNIPEIDFKDTFLAGTGAAGSGILFILPAMNYQRKIKGNLYICDFDIFESSNLNRCMIAKESDVGSVKSLIGKKYLNRTLAKLFDFKVYAYLDYFDAREMYLLGHEKAPSIVLDTTDNSDVKRKIQIPDDMIPPEMIITAGTFQFLAETTRYELKRIKNNEYGCMRCRFSSTKSELDRVVDRIYAALLELGREKPTETIKQELIVLSRDMNIGNMEALAVTYAYHNHIPGFTSQEVLSYPGLNNAITTMLDLPANAPFPTIAPVSVFPAIIAVAELLIHMVPDPPNIDLTKNFLQVNMLRGPIGIKMIAWPKNQNCPCNNL